MTRDQFLALPAPVALRILFDALGEDTARVIAALEPIKLPLPPKFDMMIFRSGGFMWASETDLEGLRFWLEKANAPSDPKWAEANKKRADSLARWIAWRECFPDATWGGERDRAPGVARGPSSKPKIYPRTNGSRPSAPPQDEVNPDAEVPY